MEGVRETRQPTIYLPSHTSSTSLLAEPHSLCPSLFALFCSFILPLVSIIVAVLSSVASCSPLALPVLNNKQQGHCSIFLSIKTTDCNHDNVKGSIPLDDCNILDRHDPRILVGRCENHPRDECISTQTTQTTNQQCQSSQS